MAHIALVNSENIVEDIHVINNSDLPDNGSFSEETELAAQKLQEQLGLLQPGKRWLLTSYNNNFRGKYACIGDTYDEDSDSFYSPISANEEIIP